MIRHLFRLVWNRKKTNILIMLEVFFSFLVVFGLTATGLHLLDLYRRPLGYDYHDVWRIKVGRETRRFGSRTAEESETFRRLESGVGTLPSVVHAAGGDNSPYSHSSSINSWDYEGRKIEAAFAYASETYHEVLGMELIAGRWFGETDRLQAWDPVVIDLELAQALFGEEDPLGRRVNDQEEGEAERRVIGLIADFRRQGEFARPRPFMFLPAREYADDGPTLDTLLIRLVPGTRAEFEEELTSLMQETARGWTFTVEPLELSRRQVLQANLAPLLIAGIVGGFLLMMVVLGLTGVMWQNVTRRTKEMGLRRATGAPRSSIHGQIVAEVVVTASFGVIAGVLLAIQLPLLKPLGFIPFGIVLLALAVSSAFMLALAAACGLYPGWTATRVNPAEALHYE